VRGNGCLGGGKRGLTGTSNARAPKSKVTRRRGKENLMKKKGTSEKRCLQSLVVQSVREIGET